MFTSELRTDSGFLLLLRLLGGLAGALTIVLAARTLDAGDLSVFVAALAVSSVANTVINFGTDTWLLRAVAADAATSAAPVVGVQLRRASIVVGVGVGGLCMATATGVEWALDVAPLGVGLYAGVATTTAGAVRRARGEITSTALAGTAGAAVLLLGAGVSWQADAGLASFVVAATAGQVVAAVMTAWPLREDSTFGVRSTSEDRRRVAAAARPLGRTVVSTSVANSVGAVAAAALATATVAAAVSTTQRLVEAMRMVPASVHAAWFPRLLHGDPHEDADRTLRGIATLAVAAAAIGVLTAGPVTELLFPDVDGVAAAWRIGVLSLVPLVVRLERSSRLLAVGFDDAVRRAADAAAAVVVVGVVLAGAFDAGAPWFALAHTVGTSVGAAMTVRAWRSV